MANEIIYPPEDLLPHQKAVIRDPSRFKILVWHRRARKTTTAMTEITRQALLRIGVYWHVFPTHVEAKDAIWRDPMMMFRIIPEEIIKKKNEQELVVVLTNGSIIQLKGADDPDMLRGAGPSGIVFDEFQKQKIEAWQVLEPVLRENNGWAWFIGTPMGKNHLFDFYERGESENFPEWKSWLLRASTSGIIRASELEESRRTAISEEFYNQEYECAWMEGVGQVFKGVRAITTAVPEPPQEDELYVMGCDLAKHQDYTVLTVFKRKNNQQVYQERFNKIDWVYQKNKIAEVARHYNNCIVAIDSTGLGDPIVDDLGRMGIACDPITITHTLKLEMIQKLSIWIQLKRFSIINLDESLKELENFSYKIGPTGKIYYGAPEGKENHDDIVISLALAVHELNPVQIQQKIIELTPLQKFKKRLILEGQDDYQDQKEWQDADFDGPI